MTRVGPFIRLTSLDELPRHLNAAGIVAGWFEGVDEFLLGRSTYG